MKIEIFTKFFEERIWDLDIINKSFILKRIFYKFFRIIYIVFHDFIKDKCTLRASALTFVTILSIVPFLAFIFSLAKGFGIQEYIKPLIINKITLGEENLINYLITYIENTNVKTLGIYGLIFLIWTVIKLLGTIEDSFNDIWRIIRRRTIFRKVSDYLSVMVICPVLIVLATGVNATLTNASFLNKILNIDILEKVYQAVISLLPFFSVWFAFAFIYGFMPNTHVKVSAALIGGIVAGTIWQIAQYVYIHFQVGVVRYNIIYGTFAAIPIFLIWVYLSWVIILFGAEVSFACQNEKMYLIERKKTKQN